MYIFIHRSVHVGQIWANVRRPPSCLYPETRQEHLAPTALHGWLIWIIVRATPLEKQKTSGFNGKTMGKP